MCCQTVVLQLHYTQQTWSNISIHLESLWPHDENKSNIHSPSSVFVFYHLKISPVALRLLKLHSVNRLGLLAFGAGSVQWVCQNFFTEYSCLLWL